MLLYDLATNPEQQKCVYQEILDHIGHTGRVTETNLNKMRYLKVIHTTSPFCTKINTY